MVLAPHPAPLLGSYVHETSCKKMQKSIQNAAGRRKRNAIILLCCTWKTQSTIRASCAEPGENSPPQAKTGSLVHAGRKVTRNKLKARPARKQDGGKSKISLVVLCSTLSIHIQLPHCLSFSGGVCRLGSTDLYSWWA